MQRPPCWNDISSLSQSLEESQGLLTKYSKSVKLSVADSESSSMAESDVTTPIPTTPSPSHGRLPQWPPPSSPTTQPTAYVAPPSRPVLAALPTIAFTPVEARHEGDILPTRGLQRHAIIDALEDMYAAAPPPRASDAMRGVSAGSHRGADVPPPPVVPDTDSETETNEAIEICEEMMPEWESFKAPHVVADRENAGANDGSTYTHIKQYHAMLADEKLPDQMRRLVQENLDRLLEDEMRRIRGDDEDQREGSREMKKSASVRDMALLSDSPSASATSVHDNWIHTFIVQNKI
ncbi:hypothetical protein DXG01_005452 [Tephrocybe rancida]|nr:hypothetical protein DXG01_005452 [Tephrocybe rancida]